MLQASELVDRIIALLKTDFFRWLSQSERFIPDWYTGENIKELIIHEQRNRVVVSLIKEKLQEKDIEFRKLQEKYIQKLGFDKKNKSQNFLKKIDVQRIKKKISPIQWQTMNTLLYELINPPISSVLNSILWL
jgi:hypothetical protein